MSFLDMRTIVFGNVVTNIVCMLVILLLWHQSRKRFAGTGFWVFDYAFQTAALFLVILRGSIPDWMSMVLANTLVVAGALLGYMGPERFVGKKISQVPNYVLLGAFVCVHTYFAFVQPRVKQLSGLLPICSSCKKIRDDKGYWTQIESYVRRHSEADFSHSICPDCARRLYPDANPYEDDEGKESRK